MRKRVVSPSVLCCLRFSFSGGVSFLDGTLVFNVGGGGGGAGVRIYLGSVVFKRFDLLNVSCLSNHFFKTKTPSREMSACASVLFCFCCCSFLFGVLCSVVRCGVDEKFCLLNVDLLMCLVFGLQRRLNDQYRQTHLHTPDDHHQGRISSDWSRFWG